MTSFFSTVLLPIIEIDFPPIKDHNYTATCNATGNPIPIIEAKLSSSIDCPYTTSYANISMYTRQVAVILPHVTSMCYNVTVYCYVKSCKKDCPPLASRILHTLESKLFVHTTQKGGYNAFSSL